MSDRIQISTTNPTTLQMTVTSAGAPVDTQEVKLEVPVLGFVDTQTTDLNGEVSFVVPAASGYLDLQILDATVRVASNFPKSLTLECQSEGAVWVGGITVDDDGITYYTGTAGAIPGPEGPPGPAGPGVPTGGTTGQVLAKVDGTDYNTEWVTGGGGGSPSYPLLAGSSVTANTSGNGQVTFDQFWSGSLTLEGQQQWKKENFGSYFRNIDATTFSASTTFNSVTIDWKTVNEQTVFNLSQSDFEGHIDILFANWLTHCQAAVDAQVATYPDDYQDRMYIVADMEAKAADVNFHKNFSTVRLRIKQGTTYDATANPFSIYFGDGTSNSPKSINTKGQYFLDKIEGWLNGMEALYPWATGRIQWYNLPQSLSTSQLQAAAAESSTPAQAEAYYLDWMSRYSSIVGMPVTQFESLVSRMGPHADFYPPTFAVKPEYLIGYCQAMGSLGGTVVMDGNLQPNQTGAATLWDGWNAFTADDFVMVGYYQPNGTSNRWRMPHSVIQYLQRKIQESGGTTQQFMAFAQDSIMFDDSQQNASLLAAMNLSWPTLNLTDDDAGAPGIGSSGDLWGRVRRSEMMYGDGSFDDFFPGSDGDTAVEYLLDSGHGSAVLSGGEITQDNATQFTVAAGEGFIITQDGVGQPWYVKKITWPQYAAQTPTYGLTGRGTNIAIDTNGFLVQSPGFATPQERRTRVQIGQVYHPEADGQISAVQNASYQGPDAGGHVQDLFRGFGKINIDGNTYSGFPTLGFARSAGTTMSLGANVVNDIYNPNFLDFSSEINLDFRTVTQLGVTGPEETVFNPDLWDNGGTLEPTPGIAPRWTNTYIYLFDTGQTVIMRGQTTYLTEFGARNGIATEDHQTWAELNDAAIFRCILTCVSTATDLTDPGQAIFHEIGKFGTIAGASSGVSVSMTDLTDTPDIDPSDAGEILQWDGSVYQYTLLSGDNIPATGSSGDSVSDAISGLAIDIATLDGEKVSSLSEGGGTDVIANIVSCTQSEYDLLTPVATTVYLITGP